MNFVTIDVLVFGAAHVCAKSDRVSVRIAQPATAADVLAALAAQHPQLAFTLSAARLAVNQSLAQPRTAVCALDELALISMVGGG